MNNNFIVSIPTDLKLIESKLWFGLTKRQLIGFGITVLFAIPTYFLLKNISIDTALYGLFFVSLPIMFSTVYKKDNMYTETWIKLYIKYKYLNPNKRYYKVTAKNKKVAIVRGLISVKKGKQPIQSASKIS